MTKAMKTNQRQNKPTKGKGQGYVNDAKPGSPEDEVEEEEEEVFITWSLQQSRRSGRQQQQCVLELLAH